MSVARISVLVLAALLVFAGIAPASACEFCAGGGDSSSTAILNWMIASAHASLLESLLGGNAALARGEVTAAILLPLSLGLGYGVLHTLGPGHGKIVFGAHSFARTFRKTDIALQAFASGALHIASALLLLLALQLVFQVSFTPGDTRLAPVQIAGYALIVLVGALMIARALFPHAPIIGHRHGDHASTAGVILSVGIVPCTGSLLVIAFALANGALLLGLAVVVAIGLGMALTLSSVGLIASSARDAAGSHIHRDARWPGIAGGVVLVFIGLLFLHGLTV